MQPDICTPLPRQAIPCPACLAEHGPCEAAYPEVTHCVEGPEGIACWCAKHCPAEHEEKAKCGPK